jgi:hypothetical protein
MKKDTSVKHDNFLADAVKPARSKHIGYLDGFRFGFGFFTAGLLVTLILAGLSWAMVALMGLK